MVLFEAAALADRQLGALGERYTVGALLGTGRFSQVSMGLARSGATEAPSGKCALKVICFQLLQMQAGVVLPAMGPPTPQGQSHQVLGSGVEYQQQDPTKWV